jgi:outer membrane protein assembly factor BamA
VIEGNSITKERIILRELTINAGDTIDTSSLAKETMRSRENLLNTSLFNYVTINIIQGSTPIVNLIIIVEERWYTWPSIILKYEDRNFSSWLKARDLSKSKYGFAIDRFNCFGRKENFKIAVSSGYAKQFFVSYKNIAIDKDRKHFIGADMEISRHDEIIYRTKDNKPEMISNHFQIVFERKKYTLNYLYRPFIIDFHNFYFNYFEYNISDTINKLNPDYLVRGKTSLNCITFDYVFTHDTRDIKAYPLHGSYFEFLLGQTVSVPFSVDPFYSTTFTANFYKYAEIKKRVFYAGGLSLKISNANDYSYYYSKSLGYIYNLHGFEYNTIDGQHFLLFKNLIKFTLLSSRIAHLKFIPLRKFNKIHFSSYLNIFSDCGYVFDKQASPDNTYANKMLYSVGTGLDLVTYYDRTIRFEYSVNGFGIGGLYVHLTAPINK